MGVPFRSGSQLCHHCRGFRVALYSALLSFLFFSGKEREREKKQAINKRKEEELEKGRREREEKEKEKMKGA